MGKRMLLILCLMSLLFAAMQVSAAEEKVQITLWHHWDGARSEWVQKMLDDFMKENPSIEVTQALTSAVGAQTKLTAFLLSGSTPEVVMLRSSYAQQLIMTGELMSLDQFLTKDNVNLDMFVPADLTAFQFNGSTYGLPIMSGAAWTNLIFYNKRIMEEAGLAARSPKTWDEWLTMSKRLTKRDGDGKLIQAGTEIPPLSWAAPWNGAIMWSQDMKNATVNTPRMAETVNFMRELLESQYGSYQENRAFNGVGFDQAFFQDRQAFSVKNNSAFAHLPNYDLDWGAGLAPVSDLHSDNEAYGLVLSSWSYAMPRTLTGEKRAATWKLLKYLTTAEEAAGWFTRIQGRPSPVLRFNSHPEYLQTNPYWNVVIEAAQRAIPAPTVSLGDVDVAFNNVLINAEHPEQALNTAEMALQLKLDELWGN